MKKLFFALSFMGTLMVSAQSDKGDFTLSPQIGVNFSTYASEASFKSRTSFAGGAIVEYYFSDRWSLRSGMLYDQMGAKDGGNNIDKLNYLTIPLNANWHFGKNRNWFLNFGAAIAVLANADSELSDGTKIDIKDSVSSTDVGLAVGIGYKFDINENLQLVVDYQGFGGLINIDKDGLLPYEINNSRSSFNFGAVFKL